jgi:hypothetical protein
MTEFTKEFIDEARKSITEPGIERYICIPVQLEMLDEIERLQDKIAELESELVTTRQKLTDCEAKIAERDKALNDMVHELSRMEIDKNVLLYETEKVIEKKNDEIANLKLRLALLQDEYRWIPTSERQPKKDWFYFARENVNQVIGYYSWNHKNGWCDGKRKNIKTVTHWMKVPKLTKEESER